MNITVVCKFCRYHDKEPNLEINFKDGKVYYVCEECKKENVIQLKVENRPYPKTSRLK